MNRMNIRIWLTASQRRALGLFCCMVLMIAGCTVGTICTLTDSWEPLCRFCVRYGISWGDFGEGSVFLAAIRWNGCVLLVSFCLGFCAIGQPFLGALLMLHGFGVGCMLMEISDTGAGKTMLLQYIFTAAYGMGASFLLLLGVREAVRLSCVYIRTCICSTDAQEMSRRVRLYALRFGVLLIFLLAASGIYAFLYRIVL